MKYKVQANRYGDAFIPSEIAERLLRKGKRIFRAKVVSGNKTQFLYCEIIRLSRKYIIEFYRDDFLRERVKFPYGELLEITIYL